MLATGCKRLRASRALARAANDHTGDILRTDVLSHCSPDGTPMATRVRRYTGADWVGENIATVTRKGSAARKVVRMWMASPRPPRRAAVAERPPHRRRQAKRQPGRRHGAAVFTADLASRH